MIGAELDITVGSAETCTISDPDLSAPGEDDLEPVAQTPDSNGMMDRIAKGYVYEILYDNPGLLTSSTILDSFFDEKSGSVIEDFHDVYLTERAAQEITTPTPGFVGLKTGLVRVYLDSIAYVDSLLLFPFVDTSALTGMRLYMTDSVALHAADISDLWEEYVDDRETGLANAYSDLGNITVATEFDEVNQDIGALRLKLLLGGVEILSGAEWDTIAVKAGACTLLDGDGVLEARGLLLLVSDAIIVDGIQCVQIEERSPGDISIDSNIEASPLIEVIPNPATRGWSIVNKNEKILTYTLYASNGAVMSTGAINQNATWISAKELISGLYFLHVLNEHGVSQIEKLQLVAE